MKLTVEVKLAGNKKLSLLPKGKYLIFGSKF